MTDRKIMQQALEALEGIHVGNMTPMAEENWNEALIALRQALAQPEIPMSPEHLPQYIATNNIKPTTEGGGGGGAQPEQEPVAWMQDSIELYVNDRPTSIYKIPLYTAPPKREWVGLTDKEIHNLWMSEHSATDPVSFSRIIEAKLKERNFG